MPDPQLAPDTALEALRAVRQYLLSEETIGETLTHLTELAGLVSGADLAGITTVIEGSPMTAVFSDPEAAEIDDHQYTGDGGPCLHAYLTGTVVRIRCLPDDHRWPEFERVAGQHGIRSTLSLPLLAAGESVGAINLYSRTDDAFTPAREERAQDFADHAAVVLANATVLSGVRRLNEHLDQALRSRATIDHAVGILMASGGRSPEDAFKLLVRASQRENRKLRDIAGEIVQRTRDSVAERATGDDGLTHRFVGPRPG